MELWKEINCMPGYEVSTLGRVKKLANGRGANSKDIIKVLSFSPDGYLVVSWKTYKDGRQHSKVVHRIVAEAFIPNPDNLETVNHKDGNKCNNKVENLEWCSRSSQLVHAYKLGLRKPSTGSTNVNSKLTEEDVKFIRENYKPRHRLFGRAALARKYNVSYTTIWNITENITYK